MFREIRKISAIVFILFFLIGIISILMGTEIARAATCTDSDGGKNYYARGEIVTSEDAFTDECIFGTDGLEEFYCEADKSWNRAIVKCSEGCEDGRCFGEATLPNCIDEDGGENVYVASIAHSEYGGGQYDCCVDASMVTCTSSSNYLKEAICLNNTSVGQYVWSYKVIKCSHGCQDGRCRKEKQNFDIISPNGGEQWEGGKTYEIKWQNPKNDISKINIALYDLIDYTYIVSRKIVYGISANQGSYSWTVPENIKSGYYLIKVWNVDENADPNSYDYSIDVFYIKQSGKICTDSDGGKDQYIKGSTTGRKWADDDTIITKEDYCGSMKGSIVESESCSGSNCGVYEFYCYTADNQTFVNSVLFSCPYGCEDGACLREAEKSITVISPNGGEEWVKEATHSIEWNMGDLENEKIDIYLRAYDANGYIIDPEERENELVNYSLPIFEDIPAINKKQIWLIPENIENFFSETPVSYKINIFYWDEDKARIMIADESDDYFSIILKQPASFYYPQDGAILYTLSPQFITKNVEAGKYYQLGIWEGKQVLSENEFLTWINVVQKEWKTETSQEGPIGKFLWNKTYTAGIRECQNNNFSDCSDWTDSVSFTIKPEVLIYESDEGKDYYNQGYVYADEGIMNDQCLYEVRLSSEDRNTLLEYYSTGNSDNPVRLMEYECPYGCMNGQCLKKGQTNTVPTCKDSDAGKNYYVKAKLTYENNPYGIIEEQDVCLNKDYLLERFCGDSEDVSQNREKHLCPYGCQNGACKEEPTGRLKNGDLLKVHNGIKIYVIKNDKKKWIKTQEEFQQQGYKWEDVQETSSPVLDAYADYLESQVKLLRAIGQNKVYRIVGNKRLWIPTISAFNVQELKWEEIEDKLESELSQYPRAKLLKAKNEEGIYYITESGLRRQVPNDEAFKSYGNQWEDVLEVDEDIIESYEVCNLIKLENSHQIYRLEGNIKHWIKTVEAFNRHGYDWLKIAPVNETEFNTYQEGSPIE